jgi:septal ring factor EnvC (AmiA/AmiB activator)
LACAARHRGRSDADGKVYAVRYEAVNAMLLNEFLKEHRKVEEKTREMQDQKITISQLKTTVAKQEANAAKQEATIAQLKSGMVALAARLKDQDSKIQKVSDQLELSKPAPQMALNNR